MKSNLKFIALTILTAISCNSWGQFIPRNASYEVPVDSKNDADLIGSNRFQIRDLTLDTFEDGTMLLKYTLPVEITGIENKIEFKGDLTKPTEYENNKITCKDEVFSLTCKVVYNDIKIDSGLAIDLLKKRFSGDELAKRLEIQERFSTDPVGIIRVFKRKIRKLK